MDATTAHRVTRLLREWRGGNPDALEELTPLIYGELRRLARHYLRGERQGHTLDGTALVHEAFLRLGAAEGIEWQSRAHFMGVAARLMRQILVDYARRQHAAKRGSGERCVSLEAAAVFAPERSATLLALDDALRALAAFDPRKSRIVELRYFGGLSIEEIAEEEGIAVATVRRQMRTAEAWLRKEMDGR